MVIRTLYFPLAETNIDFALRRDGVCGSCVNSYCLRARIALRQSIMGAARLRDGRDTGLVSLDAAPARARFNDAESFASERRARACAAV
jgi:hypothetical protein